MPRLIRYLAYIAYLCAAAAAWLAVAFYGFGFIPAPHERACDLQPGGCPPASFLTWLLSMIVILSAVPLTVMGLVLLRKWLHRVQAG